MSDPKPPKRSFGGPVRYAGAGVELAATLIGACLLGYWIDRRFETKPWGLLICVGLGIVGGLYNLIRRALPDLFRSVQNKDDRSGSRTDTKDDA